MRPEGSTGLDFVASYLSFAFSSEGGFDGFAEIVISGRVKDDDISESAPPSA